MKVIGYQRVSTDEQAKEGVSLQNQRERIESYCNYKGYELVDVIEDAGISGGKNKTRPGFIELLDRIEKGDIGGIVLYSLERISRDMLTLLALERLLDEKDIELHTVEGQVSTATPDGWLAFAMKAFLGEMERRQVKYRTKKAMEYKKGQGAVVGSINYGYRREGDKLVEDEGEQTIARMINAMYQDNGRLVDICKALNARGIQTRKGKAFEHQQVKQIIKGYKNTFSKQNTKLAQNIRGFIEGIA